MKKNIKLDNIKRLFIVPDLHGTYDLFNYALKSIGFTKNDFVVSLGDLIDRGEQNMECLNFFLNVKNSAAIIGNHEEMAIRAILDNNATSKALWISNGGLWHTSVNESYLEGVLNKVKKKFDYILDIDFNGMKILCSHAQLPFIKYEDFLKADFKNESLFYSILEGRDQVNDKGFKAKLKGVDYVFHGHKIKKEPVVKGNRYWIDNGAYSSMYSEDYKLTIAEITKEGVKYHQFQKDHYTPSNFVYL